jgi:hypothetical protein
MMPYLIFLPQSNAMSPNESFENYVKSLKAMGFSDESIAVYLKQMEQSNAVIPQGSFENYAQSLKAMGLSDETIEAYLKQMEQSARFLSNNLTQFNNLFTDQPTETNDYTIVNNPASTLTRAQQWAIACGADLAFVNGQYLNDLTTGLTRQDCRTLLTESWDIDSTEEAVEKIEWLFKEGHRIEFDTLWQAMNLVTIKECKEFIRQHMAKNEQDEAVALHHLRCLRDALDVFKQHKLFDQNTLPDMLAWDYCRIINLSRGCYDAGYFSSDVAMQYIMRSAREIRKTYKGWKQLSVSYQFARYVWRGIDDEIFQQFLAGMQVLLTDPNSPWVLLQWDDGVVL